MLHILTELGCPRFAGILRSPPIVVYGNSVNEHKQQHAHSLSADWLGRWAPYKA